MNRLVVYRSETQQTTGVSAITPVNVNDEIGLDSFLDYKLSEHLEDLAANGLTLVSAEGDLHTFSDGSQQILQERTEAIDMGKVCAFTRQLIDPLLGVAPTSALIDASVANTVFVS